MNSLFQGEFAPAWEWTQFIFGIFKFSKGLDMNDTENSKKIGNLHSSHLWEQESTRQVFVSMLEESLCLEVIHFSPHSHFFYFFSLIAMSEQVHRASDHKGKYLCPCWKISLLSSHSLFVSIPLPFSLLLLLVSNLNSDPIFFFRFRLDVPAYLRCSQASSQPTNK